VFDLLLQVLGEGRLTDALGRTADFTNALLILTSNLGVREAEAQVGFREGSAAAAASYTKAAERFFRPEFFNRLDRVIPFRRLSREHTRKVAERLVNDVLNREGFRQRKCVLNVTPAALERVIDAGYDPVLGARAMKRTVERQLTQPAAARLAGLPVDRFTIVRVYCEEEGRSTVERRTGFQPVLPRDGLKALPTKGDSDLIVDIRPLEFVEPVVPKTDPGRPPLEQLEAFEAEFEAIEATFAAFRPAGPISRTVSPEQERYFVLRDLADAIGRELDRLFDRYDNDRLARLEARQPDARGRRVRYRAKKIRTTPNWNRRDGQPPSSLFAADQMEEALRDLADTAEPEPGDADLLDLGRRLALLRLMANVTPDDRPTYLWLRGHPAGSPCPSVEQLAQTYVTGWSEELDVEVAREWLPALAVSDAVLSVRGIHARPLALVEAGTHLFCPAHGNVVPVRVDVLDGWPPAPADPFAFGPVLRTYLAGGSTLDLRTGLVAPTANVADALRTMTLAAL
jgi:ATP-dependent Clp protease ATP-binding subunit ClpC